MSTDATQQQETETHGDAPRPIKLFHDWEFFADGYTLDPISVGMVADDGREYYAQFVDANFPATDQWVRENVLSQLRTCRSESVQADQSLHYVNWRGRCPNPGCPWRSRAQVARDLDDRFFAPAVRDGRTVRLIGYYADYDHVMLGQLYRRLVDKPEGMPFWTFDLKQWCAEIGDPRLPEQPAEGEHHALADARWMRDALWPFLADQQVKHDLGIVSDAMQTIARRNARVAISRALTPR